MLYDTFGTNCSDFGFFEVLSLASSGACMTKSSLSDLGNGLISLSFDNLSSLLEDSALLPGSVLPALSTELISLEVLLLGGRSLESFPLSDGSFCTLDESFDADCSLVLC